MRRERGAAALSDMKGAPLISLISPRPLSGGPNASQAHFSHAGTQTARHSFSLVTKWVYIIYQWGREREVQKKRVISNSVVETQSGAFHTWLICSNLTSPSCWTLAFFHLFCIMQTHSPRKEWPTVSKQDHSKDHFDLTNYASPLGHHKIQHKVFALRTCARFLTHGSKI